MMYEQSTLRRLYKKLINLYPQTFRDELGESMEQTFNDLCNEKRQTKQGLFGFVLWAFADTLAGIIKENIKKENVIMMPILRTFGAVIISVIAGIAIIVSAYLTRNLDSMWIILIILFITLPLWDLWIKDKR